MGASITFFIAKNTSLENYKIFFKTDKYPLEVFELPEDIGVLIEELSDNRIKKEAVHLNITEKFDVDTGMPSYTVEIFIFKGDRAFKVGPSDNDHKYVINPSSDWIKDMIEELKVNINDFIKDAEKQNSFSHVKNTFTVTT